MNRQKAIKYYKLAQFIANQFSKDDSTKVGALLLLADDGTPLARGYNGQPRGCNDTLGHRLVRPEKYRWFEHAERNAIYNFVRPYLRGSTALLTCLPDMDCARALASVGTRSVVCFGPATQRAREDEDRVIDLFAELDIELVRVDQGVVSRHLRMDKIQQFMAQTLFVAQTFSKDPESPSACTFLADDYSVITEGYSGQPRGCDDANEARQQLPEKNFWYEQAARNAIYNLARIRLNMAAGGRDTAMVVTMMPCMDCARGLAALGVKQVITHSPEHLRDRWGAHFDKSGELFSEVGIPITMLTEAELA